MAYTDYRQNPAQPPDPWALGAGPQQYQAPSTDTYAHYRRGLAEPSMYMGVGPGMEFGLARSAQESFGGLHELQNGEMFNNLGSPDAYRNFATFGKTNDKKRAEQARQARIRAVQDWRNQQQTRFGDLLGQAGADVRGDLEGELGTALNAGGEMGDQNAIRGGMTAFNQRYQQYMLGRQQAGQERQVNAQYSDPGRTFGRTQRMTAARNQGLAGIAEQFRTSSRDNAFNQARRGMQGSSVDVDKQGQINRSRNTAAQGLQAGLDRESSANRQGDEQQRAQLIGLIHSDDPTLAAAFSRTMQGVQDEANNAREQQTLAGQMQQQRDASSTAQSQIFGGALTNASRPLEYYLSHQGGGA